ncbi:helix-turn-helix domain-containing protein [Hansschlegelia zhihuaiae]|uniref:MerR family transcriptional regulator n=1 Tax=Hansschlegelia zhihuaiae TaxID=405005 RepID=A0A4Q0MAR5_9HYPH|nr:helix-turn-helix domain-containing protein [Hansschlegelia zhihuaiae]RXF69899.1 hypothetical protein EK403_18155 [Hansschlegelia zhihuaiae]
MSSYTVGETAALLAAQTGQPADMIARQLRSWIQQGLVMPAEREARGTTGQIAAALFDQRAVAALRIMMALSAMSRGALVGSWQAMHSAADARLELPAIDSTFPPRGIDAVIRSIRENDGCHWSFVTIQKLNAKTGERFHLGGFIRDDQKDYPESDPRSNSAMWREEGLVHEGKHIIDASALLAPILAD